QAAAGYQWLPECRPCGNCFRPGINHFVSSLGVPRPEGDQPPTHQRQRADRTSLLLSDDGHILARRYVVARTPVNVIPHIKDLTQNLFLPGEAIEATHE